jgi:predicted metal-dependent hydrolase
MWKKLKASVEYAQLEAGGQKIPAKIYRERRNGVRFAITKKGAILRMPLYIDAGEQQRQLALFKSWVDKQFQQKQPLREMFEKKAYKSGETLTVGTRTYTLLVNWTENKTHSARLEGRTILLSLAANDDDLHRQKAQTHLLSRSVAQDFLPEITRRVMELNHQFFQKPIRSVNLKYNLSNWGSCSNKSNINLSTRLLFAPQDVIDYVIIHELAHLVEMNHSHRFWALVENAMPDYQEKELWLKKNWQSCDF